MNITIKFNTDNDAFQNDNLEHEIDQVLDQAKRKAKQLTSIDRELSLLDTNGNKVGVVKRTIR